jgi:hypothetical protein
VGRRVDSSWLHGEEMLKVFDYFPMFAARLLANGNCRCQNDNRGIVETICYFENSDGLHESGRAQ